MLLGSRPVGCQMGPLLLFEAEHIPASTKHMLRCFYASRHITAYASLLSLPQSGRALQLHQKIALRQHCLLSADLQGRPQLDAASVCRCALVCAVPTAGQQRHPTHLCCSGAVPAYKFTAFAVCPCLRAAVADCKTDRTRCGDASECCDELRCLGPEGNQICSGECWGRITGALPASTDSVLSIPFLEQS
jgi:hypothetical protein